MSDKAGVVRSKESVSEAREEVTRLLAEYDATVAADAGSRRSVSRLFLIRDILTSQYVYLHAMEHYVGTGGLSRGSVLYTDADGSLPVLSDEVDAELPELFRLRLDGGKLDDVIQVTTWDGVSEPTFAWRERRAIPEDLVNAMSLIGSKSEVAERVAAFRAAGVTCILASPTAPTHSERVAEVEALRDIFNG